MPAKTHQEWDCKPRSTSLARGELGGLANDEDVLFAGYLSNNAFFHGAEEELGFEQNNNRWHERAGAEPTDHHPQGQ